MGGSSWMLIIYVVAFIAIFYFMAIRPQQRQRRAHQALLLSLKKGDTIQTAAGIYGKVKQVDDNVVTIEVAKGVNMKIARRAVVEIIREGSQVKAVAPDRSTRGRDKDAPAEIDEATSDEIDGEATEMAEEGEEDSTTRQS